ncbi:MAG TPA: aldehyde dehydrogenase [Hanamia sp.]|nr:aldehyde dehydrogenase [Hanamia sp.]
MAAAFTSYEQLELMRNYYESGATRSYDFRKRQLQLLKAAILKYENEISKALYSDLKKSPEEAYATETGLVLAEINMALKKLHRWMKPERTKTNLLNFPSSSKIYHDPRGVVLIISPWNYPFYLLMTPLAGAIAGGNCIVLKPSEIAPATSAIIEKIITEIFPDEYIKVYPGEGSEIVPALIENFRFDYIFYTGSIGVGKSIYQMAAKNLIPVTLELGGKSPAVVERDADIKIAVRRIVIGKLLNAGQTCVAPDYLLIHVDIFEEFIAQLKETIRQFFGNDAKESYDYGRIINKKRFDTLVSYLGDGDIVAGGNYEASSLYIEPAILKNISPNSPLMKEEIFGPILPVFTFINMNEALGIIKENKNPLAFYVFTSDKKKEKAWLENVAFGGGCVNNTIYHLSNPHLPFGGIGNSGIGAYHGKYSFQTFTHAKPVMKTATWFDPSIKYPPLKGKLKQFKFFIK